jgi:hypothetical protein
MPMSPNAGGGRVAGSPPMSTCSCAHRAQIYLTPYLTYEATKHGSLPSLLGDGDKGIEMVYGEEKEQTKFCTGPATAAMAVHKSLVPAR